MKKNILAALMAGIILTTAFSVFSVSATEQIAEAVPAGNVTTTDLYDIAGNVYNINTDEPIKGATVRIFYDNFPWTEKCNTDEEGFYGFVSLAQEGLVTFKVSKSGYFSTKETYEYDRTGLFPDFYLKPIFKSRTVLGNRVFNTPFLNFLEKILQQFPLLQQILQF